MYEEVIETASILVILLEINQFQIYVILDVSADPRILLHRYKVTGKICFFRSLERHFPREWIFSQFADGSVSAKHYPSASGFHYPRGLALIFGFQNALNAFNEFTGSKRDMFLRQGDSRLGKILAWWRDGRADVANPRRWTLRGKYTIGSTNTRFTRLTASTKRYCKQPAITHRWVWTEKKERRRLLRKSNGSLKNYYVKIGKAINPEERSCRQHARKKTKRCILMLRIFMWYLYCF